MPAIGQSNLAAIQYLDASGERQSFSVNVGDIAVGSIAAFEIAFAGLVTALNVITLGANSKVSWSVNDVLTNTPPTNKLAQIETQMIVNYRDAITEQPFSERIPTVNYALFNYASPPAGDSVILSGAGASSQTLDFIAAFELVVKSPANIANSVEITGMRIVR